MANEAGSQFYDLVERIMRGSHGNVFRAKRLSDSKDVAIKIIYLRRCSIKTVINLLKRGETSTSNFFHPNIMSPYCNFVSDAGNFWSVMPYFPAGSVHSVMANLSDGGGPFRFPERTISVILREVLKGMIYLHSIGKYHGDIKTKNIMLGCETFILADYVGSDCSFEPDKKTRYTDQMYWVAPGKKFSVESDVWSLGIVAMEMALGRPPIGEVPFTLSNSSLSQIQSRFCYWDYEGNTNSVHLVSDELREFVGLCLEQYATVRVVPEDLIEHSFIVKYKAIKASDIVNTYKEYPQKVIEEKELMFEEVKNRIQYITHWKLFAGNFLLNPVYEKPESEIIVQKNVEALMFYQSKCQFYPPYTVLCCGAFLHHLVEQDYPPAILGLLDIFMSLLFSKVTIVTTNCILAELYSLGPHYASALREGMKLKLINCHHQRHRVETGIDCLLQMVGRNNFTKYIVATTDENILQELEQIQNTPVIHATGKMITLKSPPDHPQVGEGGKKKRMPLKVDKFQFKRKPQGPNPLSCLKKKKK